MTRQFTFGSTVWVATVVVADNHEYGLGYDPDPWISVHTTQHGAAAAVGGYLAEKITDPDTTVRCEVDSDDERWTPNPLSIPADGTDGQLIENEQYEWSWSITQHIIKED